MPSDNFSPSRQRINDILDVLAITYPNAECALVHSNPFELLIATMLSAQCTDQRVNMVTARLFRELHSPEDFAAITPDELEPKIQELGLFHTKARNIIASARIIVAEHDGRVPSERQALEALPGVGRKTANVVLSNAFHQPAIAVDTHVFRVARRLGLASGRTPEATEQILNKVIPIEKWSLAHHWLIYHGRQICHARKPNCLQCPLLALCPTGSTATTTPI